MYIVTGAAGFLGSNLTHELVRMGYDVIGIDNFSTGDPKMVTKERFNKLDGTFEFVKLDVNKTKLLSDIITSGSVILHLSALPRVSFSTDYPLESNHNNITGTLSVLEAARRSSAKRVVYSASSSMYGGDNIPFPTPEIVQARPRSNYALQKYTGLEYCRLFSELYGLDTCSLVYFNLFGRGQLANNAYAGAIPSFFSSAVNNDFCRIDGTGENSRDWTHVNNAVHANILAAAYPNQLNGEHFNIGCGECYSVNEVLNVVEEYTRKKLNVKHASPRLGDPKKSHADINKAKKVLGYTVQVGFREGMRLTAQWWLSGCPITIEE